MFKNINEALNFIQTRHSRKADQDKLPEVFKQHKNLKKQLKIIHITGTNGKGSTSKMINDILIKGEFKVGLFTSPHMVIANDRIRINNKYISDSDLIYYLNYFYQDIIKFNLSFFEIYLLIAVHYFYDQKVDFCIIEVGIGGRLDSTNVLDGMISIITNISYDHTNKLGNSLKEIAYEKAGIIKKASTTITMVSQAEALTVIKNKVETCKGELISLKPIKSHQNENYLSFVFNGQQYQLNSLAKYQVLNAQIAITTINILQRKYGYKILQSAIYEGLKNFSWIGRFEIVSNKPRIVLDGAHNVAGIKALIESSQDNHKYVVIYSALKDKDYKEMLSLLIDNFEEVVFTQFNFSRALDKSDLENFEIKKFSDFSKGLNYLRQKYPTYDILICGSLYFISEIRKELLV